MIVRHFIFIGLVAASLTGFTGAADEQQPVVSGRGGRTVALTFDDLPGHGHLANMRETTMQPEPAEPPFVRELFNAGQR